MMAHELEEKRAKGMRGEQKSLWEWRGWGSERVAQSEDNKRYFIWDEREKWIKNNKNQMAFSSVLFQRWDSIVANVKTFWHLTHVMIVCLWCLVCQMPNICHLAYLIGMLL